MFYPSTFNLASDSLASDSSARSGNDDDWDDDSDYDSDNDSDYHSE